MPIIRILITKPAQEIASLTPRRVSLTRPAAQPSVFFLDTCGLIIVVFHHTVDGASVDCSLVRS